MKQKLHHIQGEIIVGFRRVGIFPRIAMILSLLLLISNITIMLINQTGYANSLEKNAAEIRTSMTQNALFRLLQSTEKIQDQVVPFLHLDHVWESYANAVQNQHGLEQARSDVSGVMQSLKNQITGMRAAVFVGVDRWQTGVSSVLDKETEPYVRDLQSFWDSDMVQTAMLSRGYPSWHDSTKDISHLIYESTTSPIGIIGCPTLSYQIYQPGTSKILGVLVICIYPKALTTSLLEYSSLPGTNLYLLGNRGMIEGIGAHFAAPPFPSSHQIITKRIWQDYLGDFELEQGKTVLLLNYSGDSKLPFRPVSLTYKDVILQPAKDMVHINTWVLIFVLIVGFVVIYMIALSIAVPVKTLISSMETVASGNWMIEQEHPSNDEIGALDKKFHWMLHEMQLLVDRVYVSEARSVQLELAEKTAQLDSLQMQLNPHFLYNTLDIIRWQCMEENDGECCSSNMIEKFSTLLRMTITDSHHTCTVAQGIEQISIYLDVANYRHIHPVKLFSEIHFDAHLYEMPYLALQPIIENCLRHGYDGTNHGAFRILLEGILEQGDLYFRVTDNGRGMTPEKLQSIINMLNALNNNEEFAIKKHNIGLYNVQKRCKILYGDQYGLELASSFGVGTTVTLKIPAKLWGE